MAKMTNKSVLLTDRQLKFLDRYRQQFSTQLREYLHTMETLLERGRREISGKFTNGEVHLMNNMLAEVSLFSPPISKGVMKTMIGDLFSEGKSEWHRRFLAKLDDLSELGALAVIDSVRLFWMKRNNKKNTDSCSRSEFSSTS